MNPRMQKNHSRIWPVRVLYIADFFSLIFILFGTLIVRFGFSWPKSFSTYLVGFLIATIIHLLIYYFGELYEPSPRLGARLWLPRVSALTTVAILIDATLALVTGYFLMPRGNLIAFGILSSLGVTFNRWLSRKFRTKRFGNPRVLLAGSKADVELGQEHLLACEPDVIIVGSIENLDKLPENARQAGATDVLLMSAGACRAAFLVSNYWTPVRERCCR